MRHLLKITMISILTIACHSLTAETFADSSDDSGGVAQAEGRKYSPKDFPGKWVHEVSRCNGVITSGAMGPQDLSATFSDDLKTLELTYKTPTCNLLSKVEVEISGSEALQKKLLSTKGCEDLGLPIMEEPGLTPQYEIREENGVTKMVQKFKGTNPYCNNMESVFVRPKPFVGA